MMTPPSMSLMFYPCILSETPVIFIPSEVFSWYFVGGFDDIYPGTLLILEGTGDVFIGTYCWRALVIYSWHYVRGNSDAFHGTL